MPAWGFKGRVQGLGGGSGPGWDESWERGPWPGHYTACRGGCTAREEAARPGVTLPGTECQGWEGVQGRGKPQHRDAAGPEVEVCPSPRRLKAARSASL